MEVYEFLVPGRPVSAHGKNRARYEAFKERTFIAAAQVWPAEMVFDAYDAHLTIVVASGERSPIDLDNVVKPVMDALSPIYYADDIMVSDVDAHRRIWDDDVDVTVLPKLLHDAWDAREDCLYVRLQRTRKLQEML